MQVQEVSGWVWVFMGLLMVAVASAVRDIEKACDRDAPLRVILTRWGLLVWWSVLLLIYCWGLVAALE